MMTLQDRAQKSQALRYVVAKRWFPQVEVDVLPTTSTSALQKPMTDVDVLAHIPDEFDGYRQLLIDCKTGRGESPISRALWQKGLMDQLNATRGICIFKRKDIEPDHRYNAAQLGVLLLTEEDFDRYIEATGVRRDSPTGHIGNLDLWEMFSRIPAGYPSLRPAIEFSGSGYWMCRTDAEACRKTILQVSRLRAEFDPAKPLHMAVVADLVSLFMHSVAKIVAKIFASYLQPHSRGELAMALLSLLYGGREQYDYLSKLRTMARSSRSAKEDDRILALPEWSNFIQFIRHCLDAPTEVAKSPLLIRELAWSYISESGDMDFARSLALESQQASKLALLGTEYLCRAAKLPLEFGSDISKDLLHLQFPAQSRSLA